MYLPKGVQNTWVFKRHLIKEHDWILDVPEQEQSQGKTDLIALYRASS